MEKNKCGNRYSPEVRERAVRMVFEHQNEFDSQGGFNLSIKYTERLADAGLEPSVGTVGDSYDNALAETMIGLFKAEVIHRLGPWKSADAVEWETLKWVDWFNNRRLLEPIGYITPTEAEEAYYANLNAFDKVA